MKRILIATVALMGFVAYSFGQGEVVFGNGITATRIWTNSQANAWQPNLTGVSNLPNAGPIIGVAPATGHEFTFAMFSANVLGTPVTGNVWTDLNWSFTGAYASNSLVSTGGRLFGQQNSDGSVSVPGHLGGTSASLMVIGWNNSAGGTTLSEFINAWNSGRLDLVYGYSGISTKILGDGGSLPATQIFGAAPAIPGFVLAPVPEPTTFALAGLGAAALLIFRRRK